MKNQKKKSMQQFKPKTLITASIVITVIGMLSYLIILSIIPVNGQYPIFGAPSNIFIKSIKQTDGSYVFASQSPKGGKVLPGGGLRNPTLQVGFGNLVSIHLINEDNTLPHVQGKHSLNIDEFNVHTGELEYFQTKSITFIADKKGSFEYYDSLHPEVRGTIVVS